MTKKARIVPVKFPKGVVANKISVLGLENEKDPAYGCEVIDEDRQFYVAVCVSRGTFKWVADFSDLDKAIEKKEELGPLARVFKRFDTE